MGFDYNCLAIIWLHVFRLAFMAKLMALMPLVSGNVLIVSCVMTFSLHVPLKAYMFYVGYN